MIEEFYSVFPDVPRDRLYFRLTDAEGRPCNGGEADPLPLGEWSPIVENPLICERGWHATRDPFAWDGQRVWVVEVSDTDGGVGEDKVCASRLRPLCEITSETTKNPRLLARIGVFTEGVEITPEEANFLGRQFGSRDVTRAIACRDAACAYYYALNVDKGPRDDTRAAACMDADYAYWYARFVDEGPRNNTRAAACEDACHAYLYACRVDKGPRKDTRLAASQDPYWKSIYEDRFPVKRS